MPDRTSPADPVDLGPVRWELRPPRWLAGVYAVLGLSSVVNLFGDRALWQSVIAVAQLAGATVLLVLLRRERLSVHDGGVRLRRAVRDQIVRWSEVREVSRAPSGQVRLVLRAGGFVPIPYHGTAELADALRREFAAAR